MTVEIRVFNKPSWPYVHGNAFKPVAVNARTGPCGSTYKSPLLPRKLATSSWERMQLWQMQLKTSVEVVRFLANGGSCDGGLPEFETLPWKLGPSLGKIRS